MKHNLRAAMFFAALLFVFTSCNDDDNGGGSSTPEQTGNLTATFIDSLGNSVEWTATQVGANFANDLIALSAIRSTGPDTLTLTTFGRDLGFYVIDPEDLSNIQGSATYTSPANAFGYTALSADGASLIEITGIDTVNKTIEGTFVLQLKETVSNTQVTFLDGEFSEVPYIEDIGGGAGSAGTIMAQVDGVEVNFPTVLSEPNPFFDDIIFSGLDQDGQSISFTIPNDVTPGTYNLTPTGLPRATYAPLFDANNPVNYLSQTGSITIDSHNTTSNEIVGTFNFEAGIFGQPIEHSITSGSFDITYSE